MERILLIAPEPWMLDAANALDRHRYSVATASHAEGVDACKRLAPHKVVIAATEDLQRAALLVQSLWKQLGARRPIIVLAGSAMQDAVFRKHATLRARADVYVTDASGTLGLVSTLQIATRSPPTPLPAGRLIATGSAFALIAIVAPLMRSSGLPSTATTVAVAAGAVGTVSEYVAWRLSRVGRLPYAALAFLFVLLLTIVLAFRA